MNIRSFLIGFTVVIFFYRNSVSGKNLNILFPKGENIEIDQEYLPVIGKYDINNKDLKLTVNGSLLGTVKLEKGNIFRDKVKLNSGLNELKIVNGPEAQTIKVFYTKDIKNTEANYKKLFLHEPVLDNECSECHTKEVKDDFPSIDSSKIVCFDCHDSFTKDKFLHGPIGSGSCPACHEAHGSIEEKLLHEDKNKICYLCHEEESIKSEHLVNLKSGNKEECNNCHNPHSGKDKYFLKETK